MLSSCCFWTAVIWYASAGLCRYRPGAHYDRRSLSLEALCQGAGCLVREPGRTVRRHRRDEQSRRVRDVRQTAYGGLAGGRRGVLRPAAVAVLRSDRRPLGDALGG